MYELDKKIIIEIKFVKYGLYHEKIYEDKFGNTIIWFSHSDKLESKEWFTISTKLYAGIEDNEIIYYKLFNPRIIKGS